MHAVAKLDDHTPGPIVPRRDRGVENGRCGGMDESFVGPNTEDTYRARGGRPDGDPLQDCRLGKLVGMNVLQSGCLRGAGARPQHVTLSTSNGWESALDGA